MRKPTTSTSELEGDKKEVSPTAAWPVPKRRAPEFLKRIIAIRKRSTSLSDSDSRATRIVQGMATTTKNPTIPNVPTKNKFGVLADCLIDDETEQKNDEPVNKHVHHKTPELTNIKPPPIYIHGKVNHIRLLETLKSKFGTNFHAKVASDKLKIMFLKLEDFKEFKELCLTSNIQFHTYALASEKVLTVVLKGLIRFPDKTIISSLKTQGLSPINCTEIPTHTRYPLYRITFAPGTTLARVNHVRFIENLKVYWEKFESKKPVIQCYRCQAHGHTSANCNKVAKCVKCAGQHDSRQCKKTTDTSPTCTNCGGEQPANYSNCLALLAFMAKRNNFKTQQIQHNQEPYAPSKQHFPDLNNRTLHPPTLYPTGLQPLGHTRTTSTYASITSGHAPATRTPTPAAEDVAHRLKEVKATDLDIFLKILDLMQRYYVNCHSIYEKVQATVRIIKELETGP